VVISVVDGESVAVLVKKGFKLCSVISFRVNPYIELTTVEVGDTVVLFRRIAAHYHGHINRKVFPKPGNVFSEFICCHLPSPDSILSRMTRTIFIVGCHSFTKYSMDFFLTAFRAFCRLDIVHSLILFPFFLAVVTHHIIPWHSLLLHYYNIL